MAMKLPPTDMPQHYIGLYVVDFGEQCAMGYTAEEVAMLLESERFAEVKVYNIYRVAPDGTMELHGVSREKFALESGMFFHCRDEGSGRRSFAKLIAWSSKLACPCRAKLQLAQAEDGSLIIALIYPGEYDQQVGSWLGDGDFRVDGAVDAGCSQVSRYYQSDYEILERRQLLAAGKLRARELDELLESVDQPLQRQLA